MISPDVFLKEKGLVNDRTVRYIHYGSNIFQLFLLSYGNRHHSVVQNFNLEIIIYSNNEQDLLISKHILEKDASIFDDRGSFDRLLYELNDKFNLNFGKINKDYFVEYKLKFNDISIAWDCFKRNVFHFYTLNLIKDYQKFFSLFTNFKKLSPGKYQYVLLDLDSNDKDFNFIYDEILHYLWMRTFHDFGSIVEHNGEMGYPGIIYAKRHPYFCILPWNHIQYKPTGQSKLCCRYDNNAENYEYGKAKDSEIADEFVMLKPLHDKLTIQKRSMEESFHSDYWIKAREYTVKSLPISGCHKCYKEELSSANEVINSMRLGSAVLYNQGYLHKKPRFAKPNLEYLEVGFGNYCNMACLTCNSTLSTTWHDDEVKLNNILQSTDLKRVVFKKLDNIEFKPNKNTLTTLSLIKFTGGEPMINPEFTNFINLICEEGYPENVSLEIYTNCSYIPSPKLVQNLSRFKSVQLNLSIDAYGYLNDYIRYGSIWKDDTKHNVTNAVQHWLNLAAKNPNIAVILSVTLSVLNILNIPTLVDWWIEEYLKSGNTIVLRRSSLYPNENESFFKLQVAHDPSYLNINILPKQFYHKILNWAKNFQQEFLKKYPEYQHAPESVRASANKLINMINLCEGNKKESKKFLEYISAMDEIRNNSLQGYNIELYSLVNHFLKIPANSG